LGIKSGEINYLIVQNRFEEPGTDLLSYSFSMVPFIDGAIPGQTYPALARLLLTNLYCLSFTGNNQYPHL
jgi:hypothetical protein